MKSTEPSVQLVKLKNIRVAGKNIRSSFDEDGLQELADSIRQRGLLQPIVCRRVNNKFELIAGERRVRAARMAGLTEIPAVVREADDNQVTVDRLIENLQREDLSPDDQFQALKALHDRGFTAAKISKMTGLSTTKIDRVLVLETLAKEIRKRPDITLYEKAFIAKAPDEVQEVLAERVAKGEISGRHLGHDIMPALSQTLREEIFSPEQKSEVVQKIARETTSERPAKAILYQERGKAKLRREGIDVELDSTVALKELLDFSQRYHDRLLVLSATRFQYLDPGLVMATVKVFRDIHALLTDILQRIDAGRRKR